MIITPDAKAGPLGIEDLTDDAPPLNAHWLIVPCDPDADLEVEHDGCPTKPGSMSTPGHEYVENDCVVDSVINNVGLETYFRHYDNPALDQDDSMALPPGRYALEYWSTYYPATPFRGPEYDDGLTVDPDSATAVTS